MNPEQTTCCDVDPVFGYNLKKGVVFVCTATMVVSTIALVASIVSLSVNDNSNVTNYPVSAAKLLFALYCCGIATYQILISALLLKNTLKSGSSIFCSLWYISHLSIILFYACFFIATTVAYFCVRQYVLGIIVLMAGIIYTGVFIYFCTIVNRYSYRYTHSSSILLV